MNMALKNEELVEIKGGAGISGTFLNAVAKLVETLYSVGKQIGVTIYKMWGKNYC